MGKVEKIQISEMFAELKPSFDTLQKIINYLEDLQSKGVEYLSKENTAYIDSLLEN